MSKYERLEGAKKYIDMFLKRLNKNRYYQDVKEMLIEDRNKIIKLQLEILKQGKKSEFIIPKFCYNCEKEILSINDIGFEQEGHYFCKKCSRINFQKEVEE